MKLIVGLGNPGRKYRDTKHNIGFLCVDAFATMNKQKFKFDKKCNGDVVKTQAYILLKPQTYMNLSGISVQAMTEYYNIDIDDVLIIHDDLDLPLAKLRLRYQGSDGGHKGIRSILSSVGTDKVKRLKFGIGKHPDIETKDYVLSRFHKSEVKIVKENINQTLNIIQDFIDGVPFIDLMNQNN